MTRVIAKGHGANPDFPLEVGRGHGVIPTDTLLPFQRLQSLAFGFETSAYAEDRCHPTIASLEVGCPALLPLDGLLQDNPTPPASVIFVINCQT
jgi:hypothetical protein